ncbi:hypothetical protein MMC11_006021 [Xylographa trunciseda]|nr:hypothetical protein [Xylographa trunciseda]
MWTLECDGDILQGKKVWLRPGKKYLFGRTKFDGSKYAGFVISHKSISRKHLTLSVSDIKPGAGSLVHTKSELSLQDENTKVGTEIDGEKVKGEKRILKNDQHMFKLGSYEHLFRIKWKPVVLTFTFPTKDTKGGKDPLIPARSRLEELDIKTIIPYITDATTHVVAAKRNTAKGLQALINGKYIVDNSYLDALVYATTPGNLDEPESVSPLEEDYVANWPSPKECLPPPGKEPGQRPSELFEPNPDRGEVFLGYTFVFCNLRQFENLQAPISNGAGKALLFTLTMGETSAEEVIRYVKHVAGEKGLGEFEDGSEGKGVVVVRFQGDKGFEDWALDLQTQIALTLDQRLIEQNEFLDAILVKDATKLRRSLPVGDYNKTVAPQPTATSLQPGTPPHMQDGEIEETRLAAQPVVSQALSRRVRPRGKIVSAFRGIEDDFDESKIVREESSAGVDSQFDSLPKDSLGTRIDNSLIANSQKDFDSVEADLIITPNRGSRKRPAPSEGEEEGDINALLLPAAAAMKRRRIEEEKEAQDKGVSIEPSLGVSQKNSNALVKKAKARKQIDIQEVVRERRAAEEEAARRDEEDLQAVEGVDIKGMRNLAVVEEMELRERTDQPSRINIIGQNGERWDERWNGRKNFKKFRRPGQGEHRRRGPSVIVPLEEVKRMSHGIGEEYWLESEKSKRKRKEKERASQSQSQALPSTQSDPANLSSELATGYKHEAIDAETPKTTRLTEKETLPESTGVRSQTILNGKRPAPEETNSGAQKRQRVFASRRSDTDSEEDLKFTFKKRR